MAGIITCSHGPKHHVEHTDNFDKCLTMMVTLKTHETTELDCMGNKESEK
jgi:hypothetical protein